MGPFHLLPRPVARGAAGWTEPPRPGNHGRGGLRYRKEGFLPFCVLLACVLLRASPAFAATHRPLVVGCDEAYPPYEYRDARGLPAGFNVDLVRELARETGIPVEFRTGEFWKVRDDFEAGRLDALAGWGLTEERASRYLFAVPHAVFTWSIFVRGNETAIRSEADLPGRTILAQKGDLIADTMADGRHRLLIALTPDAALRDLARGKADCAVLNTGVGFYFLKRAGIRNVTRAGTPFHPVKYSIVLHRGEDELLARLNEALFVLKESGKYLEIYERHLGAIEPRSFSFLEALTRALVVLVPVAGLLLAALAWSWSLRRQVRRRTQALDRELAERRRAEEEIRNLNDGLERRVRERTLQLEEANRDLEAFAYSVSHDLRSPLRTIDGFSQILLADCGGELGEAGRQPLARIREATGRMARLIDDLLKLSRESRSPILKTAVDLTALARSVFAELRSQDPARLVETRVEEGLSATADPGLLRSVIENLLGNAWKFTAKSPTARIEVLREVDSDGATAFCVRDNGAGFDTAQADRLFAAFRRLHGNEFEGTGIGLAIVQKIVHRHGGRVWATGAVGEGASFRFTLPE